MEIFPNLPDDIGRQCLMRVSLKSHNILKTVCKRWRDEVKNRHFYKERRRFHMCEEEVIVFFLYEENGFGMIAYDPVDKWMRRIPPIPTDFDVIYTEFTVSRQRHASMRFRVSLLGFRFSGNGWAFVDGKNFELMPFEEKAVIWIPGKPWPGYYVGDCPCVAAFGRLYLFDWEGVKVVLGTQEKIKGQ
ncbi:hypothetical protein KI387_014908, partial [Taxus chinensis]